MAERRPTGERRDVAAAFAAHRPSPRQRLLIWGIVVAIAAIVVAGVLLARDEASAPAVSSAGGGVQIEGTDVASGEEVSLADFAGKPVVVNIWASWCPGCNAEADELARFAAAHPEAGFLGVNFQDSRDAAREFYERYGWEFPSVYDPNGEISLGLRLTGTPTTIFLDAEHREVARIVGETDEAGFAEGLKQATGGA